MKQLISILLICSCSLNKPCSGQVVPTILWEKTFGGTGDEEGASINIDSSGNIFVFGYTRSLDYNVSNPIGGSDYWLLKVDPLGSMLLNKNFGGIYGDHGHSSCRTSNGGFAFCGESSSIALPSFHGPLGTLDSYVIKTDSALNIMWHQCYGSLGDERGVKIKKAANDGLVLLSNVSRNSYGAITGFYGNSDWWVTKIDSAGNELWSKCLGGTGFDTPTSLVVLADESILITGGNGSSDGDVMCDPNRTCRVVKLDPNGNFIWDRCYGGNTGSEIGYDIIGNANGGFYVAASTSSYDGDVSGHINGDDIWLFESDSSGNILWSNCYGGLDQDRPASISRTSDGGLLVCGKSTSQPTPTLPYDVIVIKTDSVGNLEWQTFLGGSDWDEGLDAKETPDHNYVVSGFTKSNDGDVSFNYGQEDIWVVKLEAPVSVDEINDFKTFSSKITQSKLELYFDSKSGGIMEGRILDLAGRQLLNSKQKYSMGKNEIEIPVNLINGIYIVQVRTLHQNISFKIFCE